METDRKTVLNRLPAVIMDNFGLGRNAAVAVMIAILGLVILAFVWFFYSAPPKTITITCGEKGSVYYGVAEKYAKILARDGVKLVLLTSAGSVDNLKRLADPAFKVDIGFVQAGLAKGQEIDNLVSLGSISYQPLLVFHRLREPVERLSQLEGKRIAVGREGSGTRTLAVTLLSANGIEPGGTTMLADMEGEGAAAALLKGEIDAAFLMADSASSRTMRGLLQTPGIGLVDFAQADGYVRRIGYLSKLTMPQGAMDFGKNIPDRQITLVSPTVELIARKDLHPALSDLLLAAAMEIHGRAALFQNRGEFPVAWENEYPISDDAKRFYKSGKSFFYRYLPFRLASLISRILVVFVPLILILVPGFKTIPALLQWRMKLRINRWYRLLLTVEQDTAAQQSAGKLAELDRRIDAIEAELHRMKVPASYGDQFYALKTHIHFVRNKLQAAKSC
ncbi:MAG: ABC transporter substrate-binding protein [Deltaproteobacteria bacterium]|nr:ABC transporter substrate-binding protein [Deltaproteobacteria bacterium]